MNERYREPHAEGLVDISFYDWNRRAVGLHAIALRAHPKKIMLGGTLTRCGLAITPMYNEWRPPAEAHDLLAGPSGCAACLEAARC